MLLNPVLVFGANKNTSTIWRKLFTEISVQMISAQGFGIIRQTGDESKHGMRDAKDNRGVEISCFVTEDSPYQKAGSKLKARFGIESMHGMQDAKDNRRDNGN